MISDLDKGKKEKKTRKQKVKQRFKRVIFLKCMENFRILRITCELSY